MVLDADGVGENVFAKNRNRAARSRNEAGHDFHGRGFPPRWVEETDDFTAGDAEINFVQREWGRSSSRGR